MGPSTGRRQVGWPRRSSDDPGRRKLTACTGHRRDARRGCHRPRGRPGPQGSIRGTTGSPHPTRQPKVPMSAPSPSCPSRRLQTTAAAVGLLVLAVALAACQPIVVNEDGTVTSHATRAVSPTTVKVGGRSVAAVEIRIRDCHTLVGAFPDPQGEGRLCGRSRRSTDADGDLIFANAHVIRRRGRSGPGSSAAPPTTSTGSSSRSPAPEPRSPSGPAAPSTRATARAARSTPTRFRRAGPRTGRAPPADPASASTKLMRRARIAIVALVAGLALGACEPIVVDEEGVVSSEATRQVAPGHDLRIDGRRAWRPSRSACTAATPCATSRATRPRRTTCDRSHGWPTGSGPRSSPTLPCRS